MNAKMRTSTDASKLRRRAEVRLRHEGQGMRSIRAAEPGSPPGAARLLHELQVHQVELETQNAALEEARNRLETLLEKYTDLYDLAPIGYFSLDERGRILEVNLTGAALLGVERSRLVRGSLLRFVARPSQPVFLDFLQRIFAAAENRACELVLSRGGVESASFWANLHGISVTSTDDQPRWCRVAVSDITALMEAREAQLRMRSLSVANQELKREVVRRRASEEALKSSQREQARLLKQSRTMQNQLRHVSHQILRVQEEERRRISRELHDDITQTLVNISVQLATLARTSSVNPADLRKHIVRTQRWVEVSVNKVHEFARALRPALLDDLGLIPTLHSCLKEFTERTGVRAELTIYSGVERLSNAHRTMLYRVAQSALTNVAQHANATRVKVNIRRIPGAVIMEVIDDGRSFEVERILHSVRGKRLGILGMRERVEMVGGTFAVTSTRGEGTTVRVAIPSSI